MRTFVAALLVSVSACGGQPSPPLPPKVAQTPSALPPPPVPPPPPEAPKVSREERNHKTLMEATAAIAAKDIDKHVACYAADAVKAVPAPQGWNELRGREEIKKQVTAMSALTSETKVHHVRHFHKDDVIVAEWTTTAVQADSKKSITFRAAGVYWFDDAGLIKQEHVYVDQATPLMLTGRMPGKARDVTMATAPTQVIGPKGDEDKLVDLYKSGWPVAWSKKDAKAYTALLTDDFVKEPIASPVDLKGTSQAATEMSMLVKAVPDLAVSVENAWALQTYVVAETTIKGTQKGMFGPLPGTGKKIAVNALDIAEYKGDKLARLTTYTNSLQLLGQLGLVPLPKDPKGAATNKAGAPTKL